MISEDESSSDWLKPWEWVLERIMSETGRDPVDAEKLARELSRIHPSLREDLLRWWQTGEIDMDREIHGWSIARLIRERQSYHVCTAITWMSALLKHPTDAIERLTTPGGEIIFSEEEIKAARKRDAH